MKYIVFIILLFINYSIYSQDVKLLYPTPNDKLFPSQEIDFQIQNPLSYPVSLYYKLDNSDWTLIANDIKSQNYKWTIPNNSSENIYFNIQYIDVSQPTLYWHQPDAHLAEIRSGMFTPSGNFIVTSSADRHVKLWDFQNRTFVKEVNLSAYGIVNYSVPYDDNITIAGGDSVVIIDFSKTTPIQKVIRLASPLRSIDCTHEYGGIFAVTTTSSKVLLYNLNGELIKSYSSSFGDVIYTVRFSRDAKLIAFGSYEGYIDLYDMETDQSVFGILGHGKTGSNQVIWSVDITPNNRYLISGGVDGFTKVWDAVSGDSIANYNSHTSHLRSVRVSPDGKLMISGSLDGTLRQYSTNNFEEFVSVVINHEAAVLSVDYSPDSKYIVSSGRGNFFKVWRNFESGESLDSVQVPLYRKFKIYIPHRVVKLNENFTLPVLSNYFESEILFGKTEYKLNFAVEFPVNIVDVAGFIPEPKKLVDTLYFEAIFMPSEEEIEVFDAYSLLGNSNFGEVRILSVETDENLDIETEDGSVTIVSDCPGEFDRNMLIVGGVGFSVFPQPAYDKITIDLNIIEDDNYILNIYDSQSNLINKIELGYLAGGDYLFNFDTSDLPSGYYNLIISGKRFIFKNPLLINK